VKENKITWPDTKNEKGKIEKGKIELTYYTYE